MIKLVYKKFKNKLLNMKGLIKEFGKLYIYLFIKNMSF